MKEIKKFHDLVGESIESFELKLVHNATYDKQEFIMHLKSGRSFKLCQEYNSHSQPSVNLFSGNPYLFLGKKITQATVSIYEEQNVSGIGEVYETSEVITLFRLATHDHVFRLEWLSYSDEYSNSEIDFIEITKPQKDHSEVRAALTSYVEAHDKLNAKLKKVQAVLESDV